MFDVNLAEEASPRRHLAPSRVDDLPQLLIAHGLRLRRVEVGNVPGPPGRRVAVGVVPVAAGAIGEEKILPIFRCCDPGGCDSRGSCRRIRWVMAIAARQRAPRHHKGNGQNLHRSP